MLVKPMSIFNLIRARTISKPQATAVTHGARHVSYADLASATRAIAALLREQNVVSGDIVPILTSRCPEMVACVLAVVMVGATWVPMEVDTWSDERIQTVLRTVDHKTVLVTDKTRDWGSSSIIERGKITSAECIAEAISQSSAHSESESGSGLDRANSGDGQLQSQGPGSPEDVAYIIFTSGTTGRPKGVAVAHRSLLNYVQEGDPDAPFNLGVGPADTVLLLFSVAFDAYYGVLLSTLCHGGHVLLSESSSLIDDARMCTVLPTTPTLLSALPDPASYPNIRAVFLGGETPSPELVRKWWTPCRSLYNAYGPTEATIAVSMAKLLPGRPITLGKPIRHGQMMLLDEGLQEEISEGEICVSGVGVAVGYYKDEARTAEKFIPWQPRGGCQQRVYRTGDLGRRNEDGEIVFLGRKDLVVKNRGFLINIEAEVVPALVSQPGVEFATAFMHHQRLVAFVAPAGNCARPAEMRRVMADRYDKFLVPDDIRAVDSLPRTSNGKVDTQALQSQLGAERGAESDKNGNLDGDGENCGVEKANNARAATTPLGILRDAMGGALGTPSSAVDMESSFAELGGNSLLAIKLLSLLRRNQLSISLPQLFALPSLAKVSEHLRWTADFGRAAASGTGTSGTSGTSGSTSRSRWSPMTPTQLGMVTSTLRDPPRGYMLIDISLSPSSHPRGDDVNPSALHLRGAWESVLARHCIFGASFDVLNGLLDTSEPARIEWREKSAQEGVVMGETVTQESTALLDLARRHVLEGQDGLDKALFRPLIAFTLITGMGGDPDFAAPRLLWLIHHAQIDGWSMGNIVREVRTQLVGGDLSSPPPEFTSYSNALPSYLDSARKEATEFWSGALQGLTEGTQLNLSPDKHHYGREDNQNENEEEDDKGEQLHDPLTNGFGLESLDLGISLSQAEISARAYGVTPAVVIYTAWALLLGTYASRDEVVFGTVLSGRDFPAAGNIEHMVGPLINTCPVPIRIKRASASTSAGGGDGPDGDDAKNDQHDNYEDDKTGLLDHVQALLLGILEHQWSAAEALRELASGSHARIYGTMVFLEYDLPGFVNQSQHPQPDGLASWNFNRKDVPEFGLTLQGQLGSEGELVFRTLFDRAVYNQATVSRMLVHFRNLCLGLMDPRLSSLAEVRRGMLDPSEFLTLTRNSASLFQPYSGPANLKEAFELGVDQWPDEVAIECPTEGPLTYRELERVANFVAGRLDSLIPGYPTTAIATPTGTPAGTLKGKQRVIALLGDGSRNWLVGAIAIIKAGAVYLPLDTKLPYQRMRTMVETAGAAACVFPNQGCLDAFSSVHPSKVQVRMHELLDELVAADNSDSQESDFEVTSPSCPTWRLPTKMRPDDYAYIMFTSGSTGVPKGIRVTHRSVVSHLAYEPARLHARPGRRHAHMFSPGFDVSIAEVFGTLCNGATLVLKDQDDPFAHLRRVHATMITPSFLSVCSPDELPNLDMIYLIGEAVPQGLSDRWSGKGRTVYNAYGPCECTIAALFRRLEPGKPVTLGWTIPRVGAYVLGRDRLPVPVGVAGEIYLSGVQVTEGYIGSERGDQLAQVATSSVFLPDPFIPGAGMYKTGDAGAWTELMELRFLGRLDDSQVKVRGYRVELQEIENVIRCADPAAISTVAVIVSEERDHIFAFVTPETVDTRTVLEVVASQLPTYARPSTLLALSRLPTTPNQKLDRKALAELVRRHREQQGKDKVAKKETETKSTMNGVVSTSQTKPTTTATEQLLQRVWRETIGLAEDFEPSAQDDFLELGGNSLRQVTAAQKVCGSLGVRVPVGIFIRNTRLGDLARVLENFCHSNAQSARNAQHGASPALGRDDDGGKASHHEMSFIDSLPDLQVHLDDGDGGSTFTLPSYLEQEMHEMHQGSKSLLSTFNVAHVLCFRGGPVRLDALEAAVRQIVRENAILRNCFQYSHTAEEDAANGANIANGGGKKLRRTYRGGKDWDFTVVRCRASAWGSDEEDRFINAPFDLAHDQLTRVALVEGEEEEVEVKREGALADCDGDGDGDGVVSLCPKLVFVQHHIITDQTSIRLFFQRLGELYTGLVGLGPGIDGSESIKSGGPDGKQLSGSLSYPAWAHWKAGQPSSLLSGGEAALIRRFWEDRFASVPLGVLTRPFSPSDLSDHGAGPDGASAGLCSFTIGIDPRTSADKTIIARSRSKTASLELYLAAVSVALSRVFNPGTDEVVIGIPYIDRTEPGTAEMLGLFLDRLPVRLDMREPGPDGLRSGFQTLVSRARREIQAALAHVVPYHQIREIIRDRGRASSAGPGGLDRSDPNRPNGEPNGEPIEVMLVYNRWEDRVTRDLCIPGVSIRSTPKRAPGAKFPILIEFTEDEDNGVTHCEIEYMVQRASVEAVGRMKDELLDILDSLT